MVGNFKVGNNILNMLLLTWEAPTNIELLNEYLIECTSEVGKPANLTVSKEMTSLEIKNTLTKGAEYTISIVGNSPAGIGPPATLTVTTFAGGMVYIIF